MMPRMPALLTRELESSASVEKVHFVRKSSRFVSFSDFSLATTNESLLGNRSVVIQEPSRYALPRSSYQQCINEFHVLMVQETDPFASREEFKPDLTKSAQDLKLQAKITAKLFKKCIGRIEVVARSHVLLNDNFLLIKKFFSEKDADFVIKTFKRYNRSFKSRKSIIKVDNPYTVQTGYQIDTNIEKCFRLIFGNKRLLQYLWNANDIQPSPHVANLLKVLIGLFGQCETEMKISVEEHEATNRHLKMLYRQISEREFNIRLMKENLDEKMAEHNKYIREKNRHIEHLQTKINQSRDQLQDDFDRLIVNSEKIISMQTSTSDELVLELENEARMTKMQLADVIITHQSIEKEMRQRKYKSDVQLAQWIDKYDKDISERQAALDVLSEMYEHDASEYNELTCMIMDHDKIYQKYMLERTSEEKQMFEEKLYAIRSARAVKIIQRGWRAYRARKKRRKRGKGGKGGKSKK